MDKKVFLLLSAAMVIFGTTEIALAMMCGGDSGHSAHAKAASQVSSEKAVNVGNKSCPVTGDAIDGQTTYEYKGKTYNLCCPMCVDMFKKDPAKYAAIAEQNAGSVKPDSGRSH